MTHRNSVRWSQVLRAIWRRFARTASNAIPTNVTNPPSRSRRISTSGWKVGPSKPAACFFHGAAIATRQIQSWKLENQVRENELARNSVAVLPFLDLDSATEESQWTATLADALQTELSAIGNARVIPAGRGGDVKTTTRNFRTRTALSGTRRKTDHGIQVSVQLVDPEGNSLFQRILNLSETSDAKSFM